MRTPALGVPRASVESVQRAGYLRSLGEGVTKVFTQLSFTVHRERGATPHRADLSRDSPPSPGPEPTPPRPRSPRSPRRCTRAVARPAGRCHVPAPGHASDMRGATQCHTKTTQGTAHGTSPHGPQISPPTTHTHAPQETPSSHLSFSAGATCQVSYRLELRRHRSVVGDAPPWHIDHTNHTATHIH